MIKSDSQLIYHQLIYTEKKFSTKILSHWINNPLLKPYRVRINWSCHIYKDENKSHWNTIKKIFQIQFKVELLIINQLPGKYIF